MLISQIRRRAFTLIELLVVISILAVLMAMLLPSLGQARGRARNTVCSANLRSLGLGLNIYLDENGRNLPRYYINTSAADSYGAGRLWWFGFEPNGPGFGINRPLDTGLSPLAPYTAGLSTRLQCPDFPYDDGLFNPKFDHRAASYGYNLLLGPINPAQSSSVQRFGKNLATVVAFADAMHFDFGNTFNEAHYLQYSAGAAAPSGYAHFRHPNPGNTLARGQAQIVYLDAHVESQPLTGPTYRVINNAPTGNLSPPASYGY